MYESQFLLKRRPFAATPDPRCFLLAGSIQAALDELVVCVEQGQGAAVVSAPAGTGKTLLCERLRVELENRFQVVLLRHASFLTRRALLQTVLADLNHAYRRHDEQELRLELVPAIRALNPHREALVLVCDEAHMLNEDLLEELRILSDLAEQGRPLVRLVLVGQPGLEETLARPGLEALNQRIRAHVCLDSFDRAGALDYIDYRITWAGGRTAEIFTPEALELVYRASEGVPRCINQLCDHALLLAYVAEQKPVTADTIREALQDLRQLPLHWNESLLSDDTAQTRSVEGFDPIASSLPSTSANTSSAAGSYESVEFGADLPLTYSTTDERIDRDVDLEEEIAEFVDFNADPPQSVHDVEGPASVDQPNAVSNMVADTPQAVVKQTMISTRRTICDPTLITRHGDVEEEIVWDRYAAIDGGFPVPTVPAPIESAAAVSEVDTGSLDQVRNEVVVSDEIPASSTCDPAEAAVESQQSSDDGFDAVCARLDDCLPEVTENPGWDSSSLEFGADIESSAAETIATTAGNDDEWDSLEVELGMAVCQMAGEISSEIHKGNRACKELQSLVRTDSTEDLASESSTVEFGSDLPAESNSASRIESPSTNVTKDPARPYRNLFSQLRRKQQGLV
ncbi:MAG: AAA family ATPase [Planctomycetes bacterium]|nr:AAA family ATPase [Planctomycetota bacterium]